MAIIEINNNVNTISPKPFQVDISDVDKDSGNDLDGNMDRNRLGRKRKLPFEWGPLTWPQISELLQDMKKTFVNIKYPDPMEGTFNTRVFYVGDRSAPFCVQQEDGSLMWEGLKVNAIEKDVEIDV